MPRNFRNALEGIAPRSAFERIGNFGRGFFTRKAQVAPEQDGPVPKVSLNALGRPSRNSRISKNLGVVESKERAYRENFEQTFIKESIADVANNLDIGKFSESVLEEYATRLSSPACSEIEAVYLYDRLISILVILSFTGLLYSMPDKEYALISSQFKVRVNINIQNRITEKTLRLSNIQEILMSLSTAHAGFMSYLDKKGKNPLAPVAVAAPLALGVGVTAVVAPVIVPVALLLTAMAFTLTILRMGNAFNDLTLRMFIKAQNVLKIMFSRENTVRIEKVKNQLKFWNLPEGAVNYMFDIGLNGHEGQDAEQKNLRNEMEAEVHGLDTMHPINKKFSDMNEQQFNSYMLNMLQYMVSPYARRKLSNLPFTDKLMDYKYTMYNTPTENGKNRAQRRRNAIERERNKQTEYFKEIPREGGRRRTKKRSSSKRRSPSSFK